MSLATFKKKSVVMYGVKHSGLGPARIWVPRGPFGGSNRSGVAGVGGGFSVNGGQRFISVGREMNFSHQGTPFRGIYPRGHGGHFGTYARSQPVMNTGIVVPQSNEWEYVKPSVLSNRGMLRERFRQPQRVSGNYGTGNLSENASQGLYLHRLSAANDCVVDVNDSAKYVGHRVLCGPNDCSDTPARGYRMILQTRNAPYCKTLHQPQTSGQHTLHIQRTCGPNLAGTNGNLCHVAPVV